MRKAYAELNFCTGFALGEYCTAASHSALYSHNHILCSLSLGDMDVQYQFIEAI